jgi:hypothetical protein
VLNRTLPRQPWEGGGKNGKLERLTNSVAFMDVSEFHPVGPFKILRMLRTA